MDTTTYIKKKIKGRDNLPIKHKNIPYPQPKEDSGLPLNFFVALCIGARGSGKTYSVCKLIKYYEQEGIYDKAGNRHEIRTIIISPTIRSNPIFYTLNSLDRDTDVYENYSDKLIEDIVADIEEENAIIIKYQEDIKLYNKFLKIESLDELTKLELLKLYAMNFERPIDPPYKHTRINNLILDDLVGGTAYKATGKSALTNLIIKNRHKQINVFILSQSSKQVPKIIRINASLLLLYKFNSDTLLDDLYETVSGCLTPEQFKKLYTESTKEKYNFLCVDTTKKNPEFKQNFDHLFVTKDI
jgi:hypothetical protein